MSLSVPNEKERRLGTIQIGQGLIKVKAKIQVMNK